MSSTGSEIVANSQFNP